MSNTPHDASGFEFHRGPVLFIVEGGSADVDYGAYGAIRLFLLEGGSEASGASVATEAEGSRRVDDRVPVREDKYWGCGEFREEGTHGHRGPVLFIVEGGSADVDYGAYGAIRLFLFEGGSEASGASVAMEAEGSRRVDDRVPVREDKYWGCGEFREKDTHGILHCRGEIERGAIFEKSRNRADVASHVGQELAVVTKPAKEAAELFNVRGHRHACQSSNSIAVGADAICRDDVTQKVDTRGSDPGFIRGEL